MSDFSTVHPDGDPKKIHITRRELEVLILFAEGHRSQDIAQMLYISKRTVDFHIANLYAKLEVNNRMQAILKATRLELISA